MHACFTFAEVIDVRMNAAIGDAQLQAAAFSKLGTSDDPLWDLEPADVANAFGVRFSCIAF